jgi:type I restriction enzyme S subunit
VSEDLPPGWVSATVGELAEILDSRRIPLNQAERAKRPGPYPYFGANGQVGTIDGYLFDGRHILLAEDGGYFDDPFRPNAYEVDGKFWVNNHAHILRAGPAIEHGFLLHALNATDLMPFVSGTTRLKLTQADMRRIPIAVPPLAEQRRIVARIEALFARTRQARADLLRIAPLAQKYRDAETDRAFRADEATCWTMTTAGDLAEIKSGITLGKRHPEGAELVERPYLRVANVQRGRLKLDDVKTIAVSPSDARRLELREGDVLMNEGGDRDKLGRGWVWEGQIAGCIHQNHVFRLRLRDDRITPRYLSRYANHVGAA